MAVSQEAGNILEAAVRAVSATSTVEVGCASALSTLHICRAMQSVGPLTPGSLEVMDPKQTTHWKNVGRNALRSAGLLGVEVILHEAPAHVTLPKLLEQEKSIQFAFIDGWHMLDYVMLEAFYCDQMLQTGGLIALHDLWMPALQVFASAWCANRHYRPVSITDGQISHLARPSSNPIVGPLDSACPGFIARIAPFVDQSVLILQKTADDDRRWDTHHDFWNR